MKVDAAVAIIPARYNSTRFPGKPLAEIEGKPLIEYVYRRGQKGGLLKRSPPGTPDRGNCGNGVRVWGGAIITPEGPPRGDAPVGGGGSGEFHDNHLVRR